MKNVHTVPAFIDTESLSMSSYTETMTEAMGTKWHPMPNFIQRECDRPLAALDRHELREFPATIILPTR